jgi:hypothetical protein
VERALAYAAAAVLVVILVGAVNVPAHAAMADPRIGTPNQLKTTPEPTAAQLDKQMQGPRAAPPVHSAAPERQVAQPEVPRGPEPQAVMAALEGKKHSNARATRQAPRRSSTLLGLALTAAILGGICAAGMLVVRMGPKPPTSAQSDE